MIRNKFGIGFIGCLAIAVICLSAVTTAQAGQLSSTIFQIQAENEDGVGTYEFVDPDPVFVDGQYSWNLGEATPITGENGQTIATLDGTTVFAMADPVLTLNFAVSAGSATIYTVSSPLLSFPAISPAEGRASAAITVTDAADDGASLTGGYVGGTKSFQADYNGMVPGGTLFANLVDNDSTSTGFDSITSMEDFPLGGGFSPISSVSSMSTQFMFTVGAGDQVSGTSVFVTQVPEPSCLLLLVLGISVFVAGRRR